MKYLIAVIIGGVLGAAFMGEIGAVLGAILFVWLVRKFTSGGSEKIREKRPTSADRYLQNRREELARQNERYEHEKEERRKREAHRAAEERRRRDAAERERRDYERQADYWEREYERLKRSGAPQYKINDAEYNKNYFRRKSR